jgi:hypothetical protein
VARTATTDEVLAAFGIPRATIQRWVAADCPHDKGPEGNLFDLEEVREWMRRAGRAGTRGRPSELDTLEREIAAAGDEADGADDAEFAAKAKRAMVLARLRKEIALASRYERENREREKQLLELDEVERGRLERIAFVKAGLLALPGKLAARLATREAREIEVLLEEAVTDLLTEFSRA